MLFNDAYRRNKISHHVRNDIFFLFLKSKAPVLQGQIAILQNLLCPISPKIDF